MGDRGKIRRRRIQQDRGDYPFDPHVSEATSHLKAIEPGRCRGYPGAYARQKYEMETVQKKKLLSKAWGLSAFAPRRS